MKKTRRTIKIRDCLVYYRGKSRGILTCSIREHFRLSQFGKVRITIEEKGPYKFKPSCNDTLYELYKDSKYAGVICREQFERLFFRPDGRKSYSITVKRMC